MTADKEQTKMTKSERTAMKAYKKDLVSQGKKMEEVKMQYRDYKRHYTICDTVRG